MRAAKEKLDHPPGEFRAGKGKPTMSPTARLNLLLFLGIALLAGVSGAAFSYSYWGPSFAIYWNEHWKPNTPAVKAGDRTIADCLGVSDFYSVRLTTYFLADSAESAGGPTDDLRRYDEYCDHVPGTGKVIFAITLMEKEVRNDAVALSFYQDDSRGGLKEINALPSNPHPSGMLTMDANVAHRGKYVLRIAFGEAKNKEDMIEMPIFVGQ
jgi:hypothetical protein